MSEFGGIPGSVIRGFDFFGAEGDRDMAESKQPGGNGVRLTNSECTPKWFDVFPFEY